MCEHRFSMKEDPSPPLAPVRDATFFSKESLIEEPRQGPSLSPLWKRAVTAEESTDMAVDELEDRVIADGVGPLPRTKKGCEYSWTMMDAATFHDHDLTLVGCVVVAPPEEEEGSAPEPVKARWNNSQVCQRLPGLLGYLPDDQARDVGNLVGAYPALFRGPVVTHIDDGGGG